MAELEVVQHGPIAEVLLARNPLNTISPAFVDELATTIGDLSRDPGVGAIVLGSTAEKFFSAGWELPTLLELSREDMADFLRRFNRLTVEIACLSVGTVCAIEGFAVAGGFILALACDYRVMAQGTRRIGLTEVDLGIPLPLPAAVLCEEVTGWRGARELGVAGRLLLADDALALGAVDRVVEPERVREAARDVAKGLAAKPHGAVGAVRSLLRGRLLRAVEARGTDCERAFLDAFFHPEARPLLAAAAKKLVPR